MKRKEKLKTPVDLKHSLALTLICGGIPMLLIALDLFQWLANGSFDLALFLISTSLLTLFLLWNEGERITLKKKKLIHQRFFFLRREIKKSEIQKSVAVTNKGLSVRPTERLEVFTDASRVPDHVINLKPFPEAHLQTLFSWLPNLKENGFDTSPASKS
jgi:hypothetical protein